MTGFYVFAEDGVIIGAATAADRVGNCEEAYYSAVADALKNAPAAPEGCGYRLKTDLTWELYELPAPELSV